MTDVTLPALIFLSLAKQRLTWDQASLALGMMMTEVVCMAVAWVAARLLRLPNSQKGPFILASAFASATILGYPLVRQIFPDNAQAMPDAIVTSELGVGNAHLYRRRPDRHPLRLDGNPGTRKSSRSSSVSLSPLSLFPS